MIAAARSWLHFAAIAIADGRGFFAAVVTAAFRNIDFTADDGLDVTLARFIKEIRSGEEIAVVGDGHGRHLLARGFVKKLGSFARTIEKAEIGVDVEMNKLR